MISYHPEKADVGNPYRYHKGFQTRPTMGLLNIKDVITSSVWSPIVWAFGARKERNFVSCHFLALDFDDPETPLENAIHNVFCDMKHIIGTTKSHQKDKKGVRCDRYRVVIPFDTAITDLRQYKHNMKLAAVGHGADSQCVDGGRFFYPCTEIVSHQTGPDFESAPVSPPPPPPDPEVKARKDREIEEHRLSGTYPSWIKNYLRHGCRVGDRNRISYGIACDLAKCGYTFDQIMDMLFSSAIPYEENQRGEISTTVRSAINRTVT